MLGVAGKIDLVAIERMKRLEVKGYDVISSADNNIFDYYCRYCIYFKTGKEKIYGFKICPDMDFSECRHFGIDSFSGNFGSYIKNTGNSISREYVIFLRVLFFYYYYFFSVDCIEPFIGKGKEDGAGNCDYEKGYVHKNGK
jgi:hypothetical protein